MEKDWENHPFSFTPLGLGGGLWQGGQKIHLDARIRLLQRAKLRSPPLPAYLEAEWPKIRDTYAKLAGENLGSKVGQALVDGVVNMSDLLGQHYNHPDKHKKKAKGVTRQLSRNMWSVSRMLGVGGRKQLAPWSPDWRLCSQVVIVLLDVSAQHAAISFASVEQPSV